MSIKRSYSLDGMRLICAVFVIAIHCINTLPTAAGLALKPLFSVAVPFFFMLSGFFYGSLSEEKRKSQIKKIICMVVVASLLYACIRLGSRLVFHTGLQEYLAQLMSAETWVLLLCWNESPFSGHLWYLHAFIYVLLIVRWFEKKWDRQKLYPLIPVLLVIGLLLGRYSGVVFQREFPKYLYRNYLTLGMPYFLLGDFLNHHGSALSGRIRPVVAGVLVLTTYVEAAVLQQWDMYFISTPLLTIALFLVLYEADFSKNCVGTFLARVGKQHSNKIYILHPLFLEVLLRLIPQELQNAYPVAVFAVLIPVTFVCSLTASAFLLKTQSCLNVYFSRKS